LLDRVAKRGVSRLRPTANQRDLGDGTEITSTSDRKQSKAELFLKLSEASATVRPAPTPAPIKNGVALCFTRSSVVGAATHEHAQVC